MEKKPAAAPTTTCTMHTINISRQPKKIGRALTSLVTHDSINRLEAEKTPAFDQTILSTMSNEVKQRFGLPLTSTEEKSAGYDSLVAIYHWYTLTINSTEAAEKIINEYRIKRGADPIQWETAA